MIEDNKESSSSESVVYDDLALRQNSKEDKTRVSGLINFLVSNFQYIRQKIPWCKRKDENLDDLSVKELMQMMDKENLNHIYINKLLIMRKIIAWLMFTTFCPILLHLPLFVPFLPQ